ncbi:hypothetical protein [Bacillus infantis]|uniref:hypothetical protein n=1 Tax=Bacillus infantis TaxID=324767 RepID=UPI003CFB4E37
MLLYKISAYLMLAGLICLLGDGIWIISSYEDPAPYPFAAYLWLFAGVLLMLISFTFTEVLKGKAGGSDSGFPGFKRKDMREYIQPLAAKAQNGDKRIWALLIAVVIILAAVFFAFPGFPLLDVVFTMIPAAAGAGFVLYMAKAEPEEDDEPGNAYRWLRFIDYRRHPFSLALLVFILMNLSLLLSKKYGISLVIDQEGYSPYATSLRTEFHLNAALLVSCACLYINQHASFLGFHPKNSSHLVVVGIHFMEILVCGVGLFVLILSWF